MIRDLFDEQPYRGKPPSVASDTSEAAAESMIESAAALRWKVYRFIRGYIDGCTCDHVESVLGLRHQTASARVRELVLIGRLKDSGARRKTSSGRFATVWVAQ